MEQFNPKSLLAEGVEGFSRGRRRSAGAGRFFVPAALVLALAGGIWLGMEYAQIGRAKVRDTDQVREIYRKMAFLPQVQRVSAPGFLLRTLDGQNHTLEQHRGKVVMINFWATWCPPCVREMPAMQRLYQEFRAKGFEIVAISLDQGNPDDVRDFVQKLSLTYPVVLDAEQKTKGLYRVRALPTTFLVDRKGRVVAWGMGAREWDGEAAKALIGHLLEEASG